MRVVLYSVCRQAGYRLYTFPWSDLSFRWRGGDSAVPFVYHVIVSYHAFSFYSRYCGHVYCPFRPIGVDDAHICQASETAGGGGPVFDGLGRSWQGRNDQGLGGELLRPECKLRL